MGIYRQFKLGVHLPCRPAPFMFLLGDRHPQPILPTPSQKLLLVPFLEGEKPPPEAFPSGTGGWIRSCSGPHCTSPLPPSVIFTCLDLCLPHRLSESSLHAQHLTWHQRYPGDIL